jgi:hypothetical protein
MNRVFGILAVIAATMVCGCSGINVSKSISPLDFLLPGLTQREPPAVAVRNAANTPSEAAQDCQDLLSMHIQSTTSL